MTTNDNSPPPPDQADHILYDMPVSNNGARCRIILYKKNISPKQVTILSPMTLGGLKSEEYLKLSPQGLMPCLSIQKKTEYGIDSLAESDTIARYLLSEYSTTPSFLPNHPKSNLITRWHDVYLASIQGCLYKAPSRFPVGDYADRKSAIAAYRKNWDIIEGFLGDEEENNDDYYGANYLCGNEVSLADATLFPSAVFATFMLPKFDTDLNHPQSPLPPKVTKWFDNLRTNDAVFSKVYDEIMDPLVNTWDSKNHRWDDIRLAGLRDVAPGTIFDKILSGDIPASIVKEDEHIFAFKDINPAAPAHILIIPKDRNGLTNLREATEEHVDILGRLMVAAGEIARDESLG
eukprot:CAMPEP_0196148982 /NCGR_PEP_ID=MMETSP0910-20130528/28822_1 /TAXON_ID=49265 /ORGANISM="Thalassiosira rotula, Strain GSO102" /LENGTH=347 /DNA_ID=CAMNT_0041411809 /DNA_START=157 /DNA_END=1196 /DNA_ORIENTATION=-